MSTPSPAHWSKDFVEHLRTVHFTLIGISTGLILIVLSVKPYNPTVALRELDQVIQLKRLWSPDWLDTKFAHKETHPEQPSGNESRHVKPPADIEESMLSLHRPSFYAGVVWEKSKQRSTTFRFALPHHNWVQEHLDNPDWSPDTFPSTLADFKQWWNELENFHYKAYFPKTVFDSGAVFKGGLSGIREQVGSIYIPGQVEPESEQGPVSETIKQELVSGTIRMGLVTDSSKRTFTYVGVYGDGVFEIPISSLDVAEISQDILVSHFKNWQRGSFDSSFSDLARAAHDFEALELADVQKIISDEAAKGSEVFEAFGMKVPAGQITLWGTVILLGVQLYFLLYLRQLSGKLQAADPGWDVPWMGMDNWWLAQLVFFATIVIIPCGAILSLMRHAITHVDSNRSVMAGPFGLVCALVAGIVLSSLCWKYRPKLNEGKAPLRDPSDTPAPTGDKVAASSVTTQTRSGEVNKLS